jgi:hypothetical protein
VAGEWAISHLDARWAGLIRRAIDERPDPWQRVHRRSDPATVGPAQGFLACGAELAEEMSRRSLPWYGSSGIGTEDRNPAVRET